MQPSAEDRKKLRWCRQLSIAIKPEEALKSFLIRLKHACVHSKVTDFGLANEHKRPAHKRPSDRCCQRGSDSGTPAATEAKICNIDWSVTATEIVQTAEVYAKRYSVQTIVRWTKDEEE